MVINEPPYQIVELVGIQGWRLVRRNVRFDVRTRVHLCILVLKTKDDSGKREFHSVNVKAEKEEDTREQIWGVDSDERAELKRSDKVPIWWKEPNVSQEKI
jgi:hypothetical protein